MAETGLGVKAWTDQTSALDRVYSVATTVSKPRSASCIADEAAVTEATAQNHLDRLVDLNILLERDQEETVVYSPDPLYSRLQSLRALLDEHDEDGLIELRGTLEEQIEMWRDKYDVSSVDELRERADRTDDSSESQDFLETANEWDLVRYRLSIVDEAIENYARYSRG